ncbi:MAG TPA: AAA family ATPase [Candidatus Saccharimonadales bacterium]|nr:AAA family ATPase [Candidatus Saccharimonadales bacterium]
MKSEKVVVLVGMPGAGKSYCVDHLTARGIPKVYFGGITVDEVKRRGLEVNEKNEKMIREEMRRVEGPGVMAYRMIAKLEEYFKQGRSVVVADGLYSWTEYKIFKERFGDNALIIAIAAPRAVRHARLAHRPIRPFSEAEVTAREYAEIEGIEKGGPIANADHTIVNDTTPEAMLAKLDAILQEAGFSSPTTI